jgi:hypothetical protein
VALKRQFRVAVIADDIRDDFAFMLIVIGTPRTNVADRNLITPLG